MNNLRLVVTRASSTSATILFDQDYVFEPKPLYWNNGEAKITTPCLNAKGNEDFVTSGENYYIGNGRPEEPSPDDPNTPPVVSVPSNDTKAGDLVGTGIGRVLGGPTYAQTSNVYSVTTIDGVEYERNFRTSNASLGRIALSKNQKYSSSEDEVTFASRVYVNGVARNVKGRIATTEYAFAIRNQDSSAEFAGWYSNGKPVGSKDDNKKFYVSSENEITIYASSEYMADVSAIAVFGFPTNVSFDPNGASGEMGGVFVFVGTGGKNGVGILPKCSLSRSGFEFAGWSTSANGEGRLFEDEEDISDLDGFTTGDLILYAQWRKKSVFIENSNPSAGRVKITCVTDGSTFDEVDGVASCDGIAGYKYTVTGTPSSKFFKANGIFSDGEYRSEYEFTFNGAVDKTYSFVNSELLNAKVEISPPEAGFAVISPEPDAGKQWLPQEITITLYPNGGYEFVNYTYRNTDTGDTYDTQDIEGDSFNVYLSANALITVGAKAKKYRVTAVVDGPSVGFGTASCDADEDVQFGSEVTFTASATAPAEFEGWYLNGVRQDRDAVFTERIEADTDYVAKFKVPVTASVSYEDGVTHDTTVALSGVTEGFVTLGESFDYSLSVGDGYFAGWYASDDASFLNPLDIPKDGSVTPDGPVAIVARIVREILTHRLSVTAWDRTGESEIPAEESSPVVTTDVAPSVEGNAYVFPIAGSRVVRIVAKATVGGQSFQFFAANNTVPYSILSNSEVYEAVVNADRKIYAVYGEAREVTTSVTYDSNSSRECGYIGIGSSGNEENDNRIVSLRAKQGSETTVYAKSKNGWRFVGWYDDPTAMSPVPVSTQAFLPITVTSERTYYARFAKDVNAIYEWEGSKANKMMRWHSKVYVAPKPFNPNCIRIDTDGYPVGNVKVEMHSSPTGEKPTAVTELANVASDTARRLPVRRMERYIAVEVENDSEVDRILVGTNMGELR